jgi:hypothetical protein
MHNSGVVDLEQALTQATSTGGKPVCWTLVSWFSSRSKPVDGTVTE